MATEGDDAPQFWEFPVTSLAAGKKTWQAGKCGPKVALVDCIFNTRTSQHQREVTLVGKILPRECLAFEVHSVDYSPSKVRELLQKEKELQERPIPSSSSADDSGEDMEPTNECIETFEAFKAFDLAPRRFIQVNFRDIIGIEASEDSVTLSLSQAPLCYAKRSGKPRTGGIEQVGDFTSGSAAITFRCSLYSEVRQLIAQQSCRLAALCAASQSPQVGWMVMDEATPNRKRVLDVASTGRKCNKGNDYPGEAADKLSGSDLEGSKVLPS